MRQALLALVVALATAVLAPSARADVVTLHDGRSYEGEVLSETTSEVVIKAKIGAIVTELRFRRSEVKSIERRELPDGFFEDDDRRDREREREREREEAEREAERRERGRGRDERDRRDAAGPGGRYVVIPLEGVFGEEIQPEGVALALRQAERRRAEHIVFTLDSPGGMVAAAEEIAGLLADRDNDFTFHTVIDDAISASIWVVFNSDHVWMRPGSSVGGAVAYSVDRSTGDAQVDAKMNSILASNVASAAEKNGHSPHVARAMILMDAELYAAADADGPTLHAERPRGADADAIEEIDGPDTVLTLSARAAADLGVARALDADEPIAAVLGPGDWEEVRGLGERCMTVARRKWEKTQDKVSMSEEDIRDAISKYLLADAYAQTKDPNNQSYTYDMTNNMLTPASRRKWQQATDEAIVAWREARKYLRRIERVADRLDELRGEDAFTQQDLRHAIRSVEQHIRELVENRDRRYI